MENFKFLNKNKINQLPKASGVYIFKKGRNLLYIGKASNIRERVKHHFLQPTYRDNFFINQVSKIGYLKTNSEIEALILEANFIKKYQPKYNVLWRDDKNYFYVGITKEDFPRVFLTHQTNLNLKTYKLEDLKTEFIGPFVDGKALKQTLKILRKVFPYRSCYKIPNRACLWYHLNRCLAPCLLKSKLIKQAQINSSKLKKICQENAKNLMKILKKGKNFLLKDLKKKMKLAAKKENFEQAAKIRDQIKALEKVLTHTKIFESSVVQLKPWLQLYDKWREIKKQLRKFLKIKKEISRIEAYDISNIGGQKASGSMVSFANGAFDKNFYRRFKIKISNKPNDIAMIKEVLTRRFKHSEWPYPDLILIDGGKAQLNAALEIKNQNKKLKNKIKIIALAKKHNEIFIENKKEAIPLDLLPNSLKFLILELRDQAHRFARKYHLKLREVDFFSKS